MREANRNDIDLFFSWVNDIEVRDNAFCTEIIGYNDHLRWFERKLADENCLIFIYYADGNPVGQVRIEKECDCAVIDYSIDHTHRNKGIAKRMLAQIEKEEYMKRIDTHYLCGKVKYTNVKSQKVFISIGYICIDQGQYLLFKKKIY